MRYVCTVLRPPVRYSDSFEVCYATPLSHPLIPAWRAAGQLLCNRCYHTPHYHTPCCLPRVWRRKLSTAAIYHNRHHHPPDPLTALKSYSNTRLEPLLHITLISYHTPTAVDHPRVVNNLKSQTITHSYHRWYGVSSHPHSIPVSPRVVKAKKPKYYITGDVLHALYATLLPRTVIVKYDQPCATSGGGLQPCAAVPGTTGARRAEQLYRYCCNR